MSKIDLSLVYAKSENVRISLKELSSLLQKSSQLLKYNLVGLEKEKILHDPYCIFDYSYFGLILFRVYFKGVYISERDKLKIVHNLKENPYVLSIYELIGEFDLGVEFASPNPSRFNKEFKKIISDNPLLKEYKIILNLVTHIYPRQYLTKNPMLQGLHNQKIIGGDREKENFSPPERALLRVLLLKPAIRYTALAKESELNIKTVKSMLHNLTKRHIIKGYKYLINKDKLGINKSRLFLKLHNLDLERETSLMNYLYETKEVTQINKTVGDWDMEIDLEALDKTRIRYFIISLRQDFSDLIAQFNLIEFYDYYK